MSEITLSSTTDSEADVKAAIAAHTDVPATPAAATPAPPAIEPQQAVLDLTPTPAVTEPPAPVEPTEEDKKATEAAKVLAERSKESRFEARRKEIQAEIDGLTRKKYDLVRETEELERRRRETAPAEPPKPTVPLPPPGTPYKDLVEFYKHDAAFPKPDAFDTYEDFSAAQAAFVADKQYEARRAAEQQADVARRAAEERAAADRHLQTIAAGYESRMVQIAVEQPEFQEKVAKAQIPIAENTAEAGQFAYMLRAAVDDEGRHVGPDLLLFLADHPEETKRFAGKTGGDLVRAFGRLEERFAATKAAPAPSRPVSTAPAPVTPVAGSTVASDSLQAAAERQDYQAYKRIRDAQRAAQQGRR